MDLILDNVTKKVKSYSVGINELCVDKDTHTSLNTTSITLDCENRLHAMYVSENTTAFKNLFKEVFNNRGCEEFFECKEVNEQDLKAMDKELMRRLQVLKEESVLKVHEIHSHIVMPNMVYLLDLSDMDSHSTDGICKLLNRILRLSRAVGIHFIILAKSFDSVSPSIKELIYYGLTENDGEIVVSTRF